MIGKTISHYKILEKIGEGGMGVVYKAEDTKLQRTVALKFLSPQAVGSEEDKKRFYREAQAAAALDHPNICTVYEIDEVEGQTFIAMAFIEGETLKKKIEERPLKIDEALDIAMQVADGLHEAHENGTTHRDIKSSNVMITTKGQAKIMDFGLAKKAGQTMMTKEGTTLGTIAYMSPEQTKGADVDHRTDIWSFGVMLYEMVTGQLPFKGEYDQAVVYSIMSEEPEPMTGLRTGVPMELERIVNKAMTKSPEERYRHVVDILTDLRSVQKELEAGKSKARLATTTREEKETRLSLFKDLLQRRVLQILGVYFAASWAVIQFVDWLVSRYPVSPHLPDFSLAVLVSMIPTIFLLAYFHGKPGRDQWTRVEKIGIPVNLLAAVVLLFFIFKGKDLGAATKTVTLQDEEGKTIERVIPKTEFRKRVAMFYFDNQTGDSTLNWLQYGIALALDFDLAQDLYMDVARTRFHEKIKEAGFPDGVGLPIMLKRKLADDRHIDYFVSGSFDRKNEEFMVNISLYETRRGKLLTERMFTGKDIFELIDEMSVQIKHDLGIPDYQVENVEDRAISEMLTNSKSAFRLFAHGFYAIEFKNKWEAATRYLEQAVENDPTFAYSWLWLASVYLGSNQKEKADTAMQAAMQHRYKLPERYEFDIKYMYYFLLKEDAEKAFRIVQNKVELFPEDTEARAQLASLYMKRDQKDKAISELKWILELDPKQYDYLRWIGSIYEQKGEYEEALQYYQQYANQFPNDYKSFKTIGNLYETMGDYEQTKSNYEKALLIEPENVSILRSLAKIESNLGHFEQAVKQYQEALMISKTPQDSSAIYSSLRSLYELRGQLDKAIDYMHKHWAVSEKYASPIQKLFNKLGFSSLRTYIKAGKRELAFQTIETITGQLQPPFDKFLHIGWLDIYLELEEADKAEQAVAGFETMIQTFQFEVFRPYVYYAKGKIHEIRNEYKQAIQNYEKELELAPTDADINRYIGRCLRNLKELKKAEEFIQKNLNIGPFNPKAHYEIALVYYDMGKKEKALAHLKKALYVWEDADPEYKPAKKAREKLAEWEAMTAKR